MSETNNNSPKKALGKVLPFYANSQVKLHQHQQGLKAAAHFVLFVLSYYLAFGFRFNFDIPADYRIFLWSTLAFPVTIKMLIFHRFSMFRASWRYVGSQDLLNLLKASALASLVSMLIIYTIWLRSGFPRSVLIMDLILTVSLVGGARFSLRLAMEMRSGFNKGKGRKAVIIGAGDAGEHLLRELQKHTYLNYNVVAFFDDNPAKKGININGVPVKGPIDLCKDFAAKNDIELLLIAIPSARREKMRRIIELCRETNCKVQIIPGLTQLIDGRVTISQLRDVQIEDLLQREPVTLDNAAISLYLEGKTVLVTGAAGSIGSEVCRQVTKFNPDVLILFDQAETGIFEINNELLSKNGSIKIIPFIGDICNSDRVKFVLSSHKPDVVFHAAAYKHVPLMEENPSEAVKNNILGTKILADLASTYGVSRFIFVSTDKAVNPTSVMGATKRIAEMYLQSLISHNGTKFVIVRFGNVLDSAGSVIPIFRNQISKGEPVTVTHPEMTRYFMTIPEATLLVLQAAAMCRGGEIFVLDMGEPIKILDLAREMIRLSGLTPEEDVSIVFTGIRPGEKLYEELWYANDIEPTKHHKIYIKDSHNNLPHNFSESLDSIFKIVLHSMPDDQNSINSKLSEILPEYKTFLSICGC